MEIESSAKSGTPLEFALNYLLFNEGGFSNNPHDHGGATKYGITRENLARWRGHSVSIEDVRNLGMAEASAIYEAWYWKPLGCPGILAESVATCLFDIGVVRGISVPPKYAQAICNHHGSHLTLDGHVGPLTLSAINQLEPSAFIRDFSAMAESGFRSIVEHNPSQGVFLRGWVARARRLLTLIPKAKG